MKVLYAILLFSILLSSCGVSTPTPTIEETFGVSPLGTDRPQILEKVLRVGGGDCSADRAIGDLIIRDDPWCVYSVGISIDGQTEDTALAENSDVTYNQDPEPEETPEVDPPRENKDHCNKGGGNGGEGCDPGENPDKGNDDESEEKEKKDK